MCNKIIFFTKTAFIVNSRIVRCSNRNDPSICENNRKCLLDLGKVELNDQLYQIINNSQVEMLIFLFPLNFPLSQIQE